MIKLEKINIKCPCCDEDILITIGEKIEAISSPTQNNEEIHDLLNKLNIEFG